MRYRRRTSFFEDRLSVLRAVFLAFAGLIVVRLFWLQIIQHETYAAQAEGQHRIEAELLPRRGDILVRDRFSGNKLFPWATNRRYHLLYAIPKDIPEPLAVARALDPYVDLDEAQLLKRLDRPGDVYEPVAHGLTDERMGVVEALNLPGVHFQDEDLRYYPEKQLGSHVLGFVGFVKDQRKGQYGIEEYFEDELSGQRGRVKGERDATGRTIATGDRQLKRPIDGSDVLLTIDRTLQYEACSKLDAWVLQHGANHGTLVILDPKSGAVLALCGAPDFDPNAYADQTDITVYANPAVFSTYEPGSVFKPFTMAAALDLGRVTPETTYEDTGEVKIGSFTIRNSDLKAHGVQSMTQVLEQSLNTGAIFAAQQVGNDPFQDYVKAFGFGTKTEVTLPGEQPGDISLLRKGKDIYTATASYGQGITVTPLQLAAAYAAIANQGKLMKPYIVESIIRPDGSTVSTAPTMVRQVISPKTASTLSAMLVNVVRKGHGQRAGVPGYFVAGKTGTAQIPYKDKRGYEPGVTIGTFAGFAPVSDPKFVMVVRIDRPKDVQFAESSAAPLFGQMAQFLLNYYEVPPEESIPDSP